MSSLESVEKITSYSKESFSLVRISLETGVEVDFFLQETQRSISRVVGQLPLNIETPVVSRFNFDDLPVIRMGAFSNLKGPDFHDFSVNQLQPELSQVEGVAQVRILGGEQREIQVNLDRQLLEAYGISIIQVINVIKSSNLDFPTGRIKNQNTQISVRLSGRFQSLMELENLVIGKSRSGDAIRLKDISRIKDGLKEPDIITRLNGQKALGIDINKQSDANAVEMSKKVRQKLEQLRLENKDLDLKFIIAQDTSEFTLKAADAVMKDLGLAVLLVSLVMLIFLHSFRNSLIVFVSIPTSIISTFIVMYLLDYSLNLLSLLGLSLAIGILVDDSIVIIENIYRHLEKGKDKVKAAYEGRLEIGYTAVSITLVDVVVFLPIVFAEGFAPDIMRQFSVVIVASTLLSLLVSFTIVPWLASRFLKQENLSSRTISGKSIRYIESKLDKLSGWLTSTLLWAFKRKTLALLFVLILFVSVILLIPLGYIGTEFTKAGDRGELILELELPKNSTLELTDMVAQQVEEYLYNIEEITSFFTTVGITSTGRVESNVPHLAEVAINLVDKRDRDLSVQEIGRHIKLQLESAIPGLKVRPIEINIIGLRGDDAIEITLKGSAGQNLLNYASEVAMELDRIPGTVEVISTVETGSPELKVEVRREKLAELGLNLGQVGIAMQTAFNGNKEAKFRDNKFDYDINVKLDQFDRQNISDINNLTVANARGQLIPLKQFTFINEQARPSALERTNRVSSVTIRCQVIGRTIGSVGNELQQWLDNNENTAGIGYQFGGQIERLSEGFKTLAIAFIASILFVYLVI